LRIQHNQKENSTKFKSKVTTSRGANKNSEKEKRVFRVNFFCVFTWNLEVYAILFFQGKFMPFMLLHPSLNLFCVTLYIVLYINIIDRYTKDNLIIVLSVLHKFITPTMFFIHL